MGRRPRESASSARLVLLTGRSSPSGSQTIGTRCAAAPHRPDGLSVDRAIGILDQSRGGSPRPRLGGARATPRDADACRYAAMMLSKTLLAVPFSQ